MQRFDLTRLQSLFHQLKFALLLILAMRTLAVSAQSPHPIPEPLWLVNSTIIVSDSVMAKINPNDIANIMVYKEESVPAGWRTFPNNGVIDMTMKKEVRVPSRSLASLKREMHVRGPVRFAVNGCSLPDASLRIAVSAVARLEVQLPARAGQATELNILLTKRRPVIHPPGKPGIYVRGTAGL